MQIFKSLKDARRRAVETVLQTVGASENTEDKEYDVLHDKFLEMMEDLNECGSTLRTALDQQQASFETLSVFAMALERIYKKNTEAHDWPRTRSALSNLTGCLSFAEQTGDINNAVRSSAHKVIKDSAILPLHQSVCKLGPEVEAMFKDRAAKVTDFDAYRRRLKGLEGKREGLEVR